MKNLKLLILEDHPIVRKSIVGYLENQFKEIEITELDKLNLLLPALKLKKYSYLILDLKINGESVIELLPNIRILSPTIKILILSSLPRQIYYPALAQYHLFDYIEKSMKLDLMKQILFDFVTNPLKERILPVFDENPFSKLTIREFEVLNFLIYGNTVKEIAALLNVHSNTVSTYKMRIFEKTNTTTMRQLLDLCNLWKIE